MAESKDNDRGQFHAEQLLWIVAVGVWLFLLSIAEDVLEWLHGQGVATFISKHLILSVAVVSGFIALLLANAITKHRQLVREDRIRSEAGGEQTTAAVDGPGRGDTPDEGGAPDA